LPLLCVLITDASFSPCIAYAVYFDHKRQTDPEFRKSLKRNNRKLAKAVQEEQAAHGAAQRDTIKQAVQRAKEEGFPADLEEKETYFMNQVAKGEGLCAEGKWWTVVNE
jgi:import receptor subunit TOM20